MGLEKKKSVLGSAMIFMNKIFFCFYELFFKRDFFEIINQVLDYSIFFEHQDTESQLLSCLK